MQLIFPISHSSFSTSKSWKQILFGMLSMVLFASCGEDLLVYDTSIETPVVEAYLIEGQSAITVKLYNVESLTTIATSKPIKGIQLYINDSLLTETSAGIYTLKLEPNKLQKGEAYDLKFTYKNHTISGSTLIPLKPEAVISQDIIYRSSSYRELPSDTIPEVIISWDDPDQGYYQVYIEHEEDGSSEQPDFPGMGFQNRMMQPFRGSSYTVRSMDLRSFGNYKIILYKVNRDYAELYEMISASDLANPVSMLDNALGIFTSMAADTLSLVVKEKS